LSSLTLPPSYTGLTARTNPCNPVASGGGPGYYGAFSLPNSTCNLLPGLYVITGTWDQKNNTDLVGPGVTLYFTCGSGTVPAPCTSPGQAGGLYDTKNGNNHLTAPTAAQAGATGGIAGFAIIYDRNNTSNLTIQGNGNTTIIGTIYAPQANLDFPGNTCVTVTNGPIIVGTLSGNGNKACLTLNNAQGATIPTPPGAPNLDQ
jgi:hypothetical protein